MYLQQRVRDRLASDDQFSPPVRYFAVLPLMMMHAMLVMMHLTESTDDLLAPSSL